MKKKTISTITAMTIGIKINNFIYNPLIKYKKNIFNNDFGNAIHWFYIFLDETILRLDIIDFDYFKFQKWEIKFFNKIYADLRDIIGKYYSLTGDSIFHALKRVFENVRDFKV